MRHAFDIYASPGGLAREGEEIEVVEIGFAELLNMIRDDRIVDAKTVALIPPGLPHTGGRPDLVRL